MKFYIAVKRDRNLRVSAVRVLSQRPMICVDLVAVSEGFLVSTE